MTAGDVVFWRVGRLSGRDMQTLRGIVEEVGDDFVLVRASSGALWNLGHGDVTRDANATERFCPPVAERATSR